jgi:hypothetical protein
LYIISITGKYRIGKSTTLNIFASCAKEARYRHGYQPNDDENDDVSDMQLIEPFKTSSKREACTRGISVWFCPFKDGMLLLCDCEGICMI